MVFLMPQFDSARGVNRLIGARSFEDRQVRPGVRYVYVVVAVDSATPANRSAPSNRAEETARQ